MKKQQLQKSLASLQSEKEKLEKQQQQLITTKKLQEEREKSSPQVEDMSPPLRPRADLPANPVDYKEKCQLCNGVNGLQDRYMRGLIRIVREEQPDLLKANIATVEINIDKLDTILLRRMEAYLVDCKAKDIQRLQEAAQMANTDSGNTVTTDGNNQSSTLGPQNGQLPPEKESSSSSGSSSSSDSSSSDSGEEVVNPLLILPREQSIGDNGLCLPLQQTETKSTPQIKTPMTPTSKEVVVQNIDAWTMLNDEKESSVVCMKPVINVNTNFVPHGFQDSLPIVENGVGLDVGQVSYLQDIPRLSIGKAEYINSDAKAGKTVGTDFVWNDFRNRKAFVDQMEREMKIQEAAKLQQLRQKQEEEMKLLEQEVVEKRIAEEEKRKLLRLQQEQEMFQRRESERIRRLETTGSVNLMSQYDMMAAFERNMGGGLS
eukprot:TRINITY_DN14118_c0_g2_i5.p1 TRINITY_DN14118_c0_g2~~TRINITY_DN14118_c0_g2_i5.p1  ORF type:complete len:462 (-),score=122.16 TRINITY_DN14118_c0_g2_i5:253-1545(-)